MSLQPEQLEPTAAPTARVRPHRALRPITFYAIVILVFVSDQISKVAIQRFLDWERSWPSLTSPFALTLTRNTGGAWGLLPQGNAVFIGFAAVAVIALLTAYHRMQRSDLLVGAAFALALGGALGNLLDRLRYGFVVDFFEARLIHWPIFNIADSAITLGILLLLWHFFRTSDLEPDTAPLPTPPPPTASLAPEDGGDRP